MIQKKNKGISLIVLIVTIVVIIILATAIIVNIAKTNIIESAKEAKKLSEKAKVLEAANLAYQTVFIDQKGKVNESTIADLTVAEMKSSGYNDIVDINTLSKGVTELNLSEDSLTIKLNFTDTLTISYGEEITSSTRYFVNINDKYYELIIQKDNVQISENAVDITKIETGGDGQETTVWSTNEAIATVEKVGNTITITPVAPGTTQVKAKYGSIEATCDVTIEQSTLILSYSSQGTVYATEQVEKGQSITLQNQPASRADYIFTGWIDGNNNNYALGDCISLTANVTLEAQWLYTKITYDSTNTLGAKAYDYDPNLETYESTSRDTWKQLKLPSNCQSKKINLTYRPWVTYGAMEIDFTNSSGTVVGTMYTVMSTAQANDEGTSLGAMYNNYKVIGVSAAGEIATVSFDIPSDACYIRFNSIKKNQRCDIFNVEIGI